MSIRARKILMVALFAAFLFQGWLVYSDPAGRADVLSEQAQAGRTLWHAQGCQTCHQLHGFGGFLGPDLTNATRHLTRARLDSVLTVGAGPMPAFGFSEPQRRAIEAFLAGMDGTGIGQLPPLQQIHAPDVLAKAVERAQAATAPLTTSEARGYAILRAQKCLACHLPNPTSIKRAPDLTGLIARLGAAGARSTITSGIPAKGMPRFELAGADIDALLAFLTWLGTHAGTVRGAFSDAMPSGERRGLDLPWFEYR